jgi:hypothetical protein
MFFEPDGVIFLNLPCPVKWPAAEGHQPLPVTLSFVAHRVAIEDGSRAKEAASTRRIQPIQPIN